MNTDRDESTGESDWTSPFEELLGPEDGRAGPAPIQRPDPTFGTPGHDTTCWRGAQEFQDTCAIRCQDFILEQFTGRPFDEAELAREAAEHGWYAPGTGTPRDDVGNLLELHGIPVNRYEGASVFHLANELAQGHKVIVGVDSGELWGEHPILEHLRDALGLSGADHAVVVSGIDTGDPDDTRVLVSDPGTGQPCASYPLAQFVDAWRDSDFFMVATRDPAPPHLPEMAHFDYHAGHIPEVADMPYEQFLGYAADPAAWEDVLEHMVAQQAAADADPNLVGPDPWGGPAEPGAEPAVEGPTLLDHLNDAAEAIARILGTSLPHLHGADAGGHGPGHHGGAGGP